MVTTAPLGQPLVNKLIFFGPSIPHARCRWQARAAGAAVDGVGVLWWPAGVRVAMEWRSAAWFLAFIKSDRVLKNRKKAGPVFRA